MELWMLVAGAVVLVAITLWIVWPSRPSGAPTSSQEPGTPEEVPQMSQSPQPDLPPQGDRFEDQYTSATADLSAAGVASAFSATNGDTTASAPGSAAGAPPARP